MTAEERADILATISDLTKSATGCRIRKNFAAMSDEDLAAEYAFWGEASDRAAREERELSARYETLYFARLEKMAADHHVDFATAVRWDMQAAGIENDLDFYGYENGLNIQATRRLADKLRGSELDHLVRNHFLYAA